MRIKELLERYSLKTRQSIYNWCDALSLSLEKDASGRVYATPEQVEKLDQLAKHLKQPGATLANFTPVTPVSIARMDTALDNPVDMALDRVTRPIDALFLEEIVDKIGDRIVSRLQPYDPTWYMTVLEQAAEKGWLLTTAEVRELIGVKPTAAKGEDIYRRGCWLFTKEGKIGNQTAWRVSKQGENELKIKK